MLKSDRFYNFLESISTFHIQVLQRLHYSFKYINTLIILIKYIDISDQKFNNFKLMIKSIKII